MSRDPAEMERDADTLDGLVSCLEVASEKGTPRVFVYPDEIAAIKRAVDLLREEAAR